MNSIVRLPYIALVFFASSTTFSMSFLPAVVALSCLNSALVVLAMTMASVVLPVPGGAIKYKRTYLIRFYRPVQKLVLAYNMFLSNHVIKAGRSHSFCQRRIILREILLIYSNKSIFMSLPSNIQCHKTLRSPISYNNGLRMYQYHIIYLIMSSFFSMSLNFMISIGLHM